ncbi:MAG: membrane protein insertase YidC [Acidimicrobiales bacterium]|nr:membrane protein insertase YidC [Acidimicrobiales bacterium]
MLNGLFELIANTLNFFYTLVPNYAVAIALLTCVVMIITTPLTLKGTRSMIEMQRLQPQIRKLQVQYKDDRQKLNEELMAFYKEHEINPVGGCLPLLIQAPVFSVLFYVIQGLTRDAKFVGLQQLVQQDYDPAATITSGFRPKYLDSSTELYQSLLGDDHMRAFGVDLALSPSASLGEGFLTAVPFIGLVAVIAVLSWYQQKQIMGRNAGAEVSQQQQMMMRIGPMMYVFFAFVTPAAIGIYFLVSTLWRVGQQHYITRALYRGEDSVGVQAQKAMAELREAKKKDGGSPAKAGAAKKAGPANKAAAKKGTAGKSSAKASGNGSSARPKDATPADKTPAGARTSGTKPHPRSRKKKKRK